MSDTMLKTTPKRTRKGSTGTARTSDASIPMGLPIPVGDDLVVRREAKVFDREHVRELWESEFAAMAHESFDDPAAEAEILAQMPGDDKAAGRRVKAPKGLPPYLASLYDDPLLTREQELHLFRKMNFLKHRADVRRKATDVESATPEDLAYVEQNLNEANDLKNRLIRANLRLVVSIAKRHVGPSNNFFELVSDGNMSLIRAVEKFDFSRGNKFSTYASWAIMNNFARSIPGEAHRRSRFITGHNEMFESAADGRMDEQETEGHRKQTRETVLDMLSRLDDRERRIITSRFGLDGAMEQTLEQLGRELGITKERVRQLESRAQDKLRKFATERRLDASFI